MRIWSARSAWLVDVNRQCLVSGRVAGDAMPFVALSYKYGSGPWFKITSAATLSRLQVPGSLETVEMLAKISPMLKHAMYLTTQLGERFLWADVLCIPHHDTATTTEQLKLMGAIYANAIVTIIALDTDSEEGIPGLKGISNSREMKQVVVPFGTEKIVARPYDVGTTMFQRGKLYNTRGWTYQECMLSCRKVVFHEKELKWVCSCNFWGEGRATGLDIQEHDYQYFNRQMDSILTGLPDTAPLNEIFTEFNYRELSNDADALPAISGLLSVLS
ncbi:HET-domain-containing protein [Xylaria bambusicola]|uniref:HET-domain-containing protein n=1 Tax=Xylaria bambusicola TaxID=326684 RepID=UPI0020075957|nr:HET-domain-containing protein [Xylaria bambusicola]KAI0521655.1 HET-domain-containing protein [Xylaria bambusicola]